MAKAHSLSNLSDADIDDVTTTSIAAFQTSPASFGTTTAEITVLQGLATTFSGDLANQISILAQAKAATAQKNASRDLLEKKLRSMRDKAKSVGTSEALMAQTGLPSGGETVPPTATIPILSVDTSRRQQHTLSWVEATTPDNKKRPRGAMGLEIYRKIDGPPPTDESQCTFVTVDSATPYTIDYAGDAAGKMIHYLSRWKMRDGSTLAWAETVSATVTG